MKSNICSSEEDLNCRVPTTGKHEGKKLCLSTGEGNGFLGYACLQFNGFFITKAHYVESGVSNMKKQKKGHNIFFFDICKEGTTKKRTKVSTAPVCRDRNTIEQIQFKVNMQCCDMTRWRFNFNP